MIWLHETNKKVFFFYPKSLLYILFKYFISTSIYFPFFLFPHFAFCCSLKRIIFFLYFFWSQRRIKKEKKITSNYCIFFVMLIYKISKENDGDDETISNVYWTYGLREVLYRSINIKLTLNQKQHQWKKKGEEDFELMKKKTFYLFHIPIYSKLNNKVLRIQQKRDTNLSHFITLLCIYTIKAIFVYLCYK